MFLNAGLPYRSIGSVVADKPERAANRRKAAPRHFYYLTARTGSSTQKNGSRADARKSPPFSGLS
jgi:hypothetical protein